MNLFFTLITSFYESHPRCCLICKLLRYIFFPIGILLIYQLLQSMDHSSTREYAKWMSYHLTNTKLAWPYWQAWYDDFSDPENTAAAAVNRVFCHSIIDKLCRVFPPNVVQASIPDVMKVWIDNITVALESSVHGTVFSINRSNKNPVQETTNSIMLAVRDKIIAQVDDLEIQEYLDAENEILDEGDDVRTIVFAIA